ncbi:MAG: hypothetical protein COV07_04095 [Candidatus Vogelbacteria bacterium CG10_big_fil_rev_8_21_14_0_10_45_14]|uniref:Uncharacterized protein n=1 Tax=Candidatus Vogelbacteria bacterium CG10_big_fil_rev_8_21_14_0_10_45_14 TaxID=1975042 RepID=A0A2H0RIR8_9BACT|nr:MAG: hypothetical protein COV07_04095 [Candidatus Vogelbacteria bacterium CG10_big_fil_rev_8_21_14_0_10_45_14]
MYIRISVTPNSKKESLKETGPARFEVTLREKAEGNMANRRLLELLASYFKVPRSHVTIVSGHRSTRKILDVELKDNNAKKL